MIRLPLIALFACTGDEVRDTDPLPPPPDTDPTEDTDPDTDPPPPVGSAELTIGADNNYSVSVDWTIPFAPVRDRFNLTFAWSDVAADAYGVERDPSTYGEARLIQLGLPRDEVEAAFEADDLYRGTRILGVWTASAAARSIVRLADFADDAGTALDFTNSGVFVESTTSTWLFLVGDVVGERFDPRLVFGIEPRAAVATPNRLDFVSGSSSVSVTATIDGVPLLTDDAWGRFEADWRGLATTALGLDYDRQIVDVLFIGHWADPVTSEALAAQILDLQASATEWYTADIQGDRSILLELARDADRNNFGGFQAGGTWVIGASCGTCLGPAPHWLATIDVQ